MQKRQSNLKFVNLHGHSVAGSPFDALGYPQEHMEFAYENGMDSLALTDHGNMNGFAYQNLHGKQMNKVGKVFKPVYGVESYFIESVEQWSIDYQIYLAEKDKKKKEEDSTGIVFESGGEHIIQDKIKGNAHLLLLAQNNAGLKNLFQLVSKSHSKVDGFFFKKPRIDFGLLEQHSEGLICSTTCISGVFAKIIWQNPDETLDVYKMLMRPYLEKFLNIFGTERYLVELQWNNIIEQHKLNLCKIDLAKEYGLRLISTVDSHYPRPELWKQREIYKRLAWLGRTHKPKWITDDIPESVEEIGYELYPKNGDQMFSDYKKYATSVGYHPEYDDEIIKQSIENTYWVAHELIENVQPDTSPKLPGFLLNKEQNPDDVLKQRCFDILNKDDKFKARYDEYAQRLNTELDVVKNRGFSKYFITAQGIMDIAKRNMLTGPGRGSSGGSLIAYLLGITQIDPIRWNTMFSRFLRSDATDFPDIDMDFAREDELKKTLIREWGDDNVVHISNWNTLQIKSLIKDVGKFFDIPFEEVNNVTNRMMKEAEPLAKQKHGIKSGVYNPTWLECLEFSETLQTFLKNYPQILEYVEGLVGQIRSCGTHAGGMVISENLSQNMPLIISDGERRTPWSEGQNVRQLEPLGFIKFDILGLSSYRMIENCILGILKKQGNANPTDADIVRFYQKHLHPDVIDFDDQHVYDNVYIGGKFVGIFQFAEKGAQAFCKKAEPRSLFELAVVNAIYRPGPLGANVDEEYVKAKMSKSKKIQYINETYEKITKKTLGFLIFQEQIAEIIGGLSKYLTEEDGHNVRKLLTKKEKGGNRNIDTEDEFIRKMVNRDISVQNAQKLKVYYEKFVNGCIESGLDKARVEKIWDTIEYYSGYGFNFSHSLAYSMVSFQCAYLFTYYPNEWICAYLNKELGKDRENAINNVMALGYEFGEVNINESGTEWQIVNGKLLPPLTLIKGVGDKATEEIVRYRPFRDLEHLLFHPEMSYQKFNKKTLDAITRANGLKCFYKQDGISHGRHCYKAILENRPQNVEELKENIKNFADIEDFSKSEYIANECELLGIYPVHKVVKRKTLELLAQIDVAPISEFSKELTEGVAWCIPIELQEKTTGNGRKFWIVKVIDTNLIHEEVKVWGVREDDVIALNVPCMMALDYSPKWGFSLKNIKKCIRKL